MADVAVVAGRAHVVALAHEVALEGLRGVGAGEPVVVHADGALHGRDGQGPLGGRAPLDAPGVARPEGPHGEGLRRYPAVAEVLSAEDQLHGTGGPGAEVPVHVYGRAPGVRSAAVAQVTIPRIVSIWGVVGLIVILVTWLAAPDPVPLLAARRLDHGAVAAADGRVVPVVEQDVPELGVAVVGHDRPAVGAQLLAHVARPAGVPHVELVLAQEADDEGGAVHLRPRLVAGVDPAVSVALVVAEVTVLDPPDAVLHHLAQPSADGLRGLGHAPPVRAREVAHVAVGGLVPARELPDGVAVPGVGAPGEAGDVPGGVVGAISRHPERAVRVAARNLPDGGGLHVDHRPGAGHPVVGVRESANPVGVPPGGVPGLRADHGLPVHAGDREADVVRDHVAEVAGLGLSVSPTRIMISSYQLPVPDGAIDGRSKVRILIAGTLCGLYNYEVALVVTLLR